MHNGVKIFTIQAISCFSDSDTDPRRSRGRIGQGRPRDLGAYREDRIFLDKTLPELLFKLDGLIGHKSTDHVVAELQAEVQTEGERVTLMYRTAKDNCRDKEGHFIGSHMISLTHLPMTGYQNTCTDTEEVYLWIQMISKKLIISDCFLPDSAFDLIARETNN